MSLCSSGTKKYKTPLSCAWPVYTPPLCASGATPGTGPAGFGVAPKYIVIGVSVLFVLIVVVGYLLYKFCGKVPPPMPDYNKGGSYVDWSEQSPGVFDVPEGDIEILLDCPLGVGEYGEVYRGLLRVPAPLYRISDAARQAALRNPQLLRNCNVAVKREKICPNQSSREWFLAEIKLMQFVDYSPFIVNILGCRVACEEPILVMEYCENGSMKQFIKQHKEELQLALNPLPNSSSDGEQNYRRLSYRHLISMAWQISNALEHLASKRVIHRDVAARNVLLDGGLRAKLGDFGLGRQLDDESTIYKSGPNAMIEGGRRMPVHWMAPESLKHYEFSAKTDIWSYGVFLWEVFSLGDVPYSKMPYQILLSNLEANVTLARPDTCPNEIYDLMTTCWRREPSERPAAEDLKQSLYTLIDRGSGYYGYLTFAGEQRQLFRAEEADADDNNDENGDAISLESVSCSMTRPSTSPGPVSIRIELNDCEDAQSKKLR